MNHIIVELLEMLRAYPVLEGLVGRCEVPVGILAVLVRDKACGPVEKSEIPLPDGEVDPCAVDLHHMNLVDGRGLNLLLRDSLPGGELRDESSLTGDFRHEKGPGKQDDCSSPPHTPY